MLIIGEEFNPAACIDCPVRTDCAAADLSYKVGSVLIQSALNAEISMYSAVDDYAIKGVISTEEEFAEKIADSALNLVKQTSGMRQQLAGLLRDSYGILNGFLSAPEKDTDAVVDEESYARTRNEIFDNMRKNYPEFNDLGIRSRDLVEAVLALEMHEKADVCKATDLDDTNNPWRTDSPEVIVTPVKV